MPAAKKTDAKVKNTDVKVKRVLAPMQYMEGLYQENTPEFTFSAKTEDEWKTWHKKLRAKFLDLLGGCHEKKCDLAPQVSKKKKFDGYTREHVVFQSRPGLTVAAWVLVPQKITGPVPTLLCLQGHGAGKDEIVGINDDGTERSEYGGYQKDFALQAVLKGYMVIAPDMFSFGERRDKPEIAQSKGVSSCRRPSFAAMMLGQTVPGIRVYDIMRCIDYLETRDECDKKRIGCMGISGGSTITTFASAVDERISAAMISGYLSYWKDSIFDIWHCEDNYVPGILKYAEMPDIAAMIAPRPVFFENGTEDNIFPLRSARAAFKHVQSAYEVLGLEHRCDMEVFKGDHQFWGVKGFQFLDRWLKSQ